MAVTRRARFLGQHIVNDSVVVVLCDARRNVIKAQGVTHAPSDIVVCTGCIAAQTQPPDDVIVAVKSESSAEDDHTAEMLAQQGIRGTAKL